MWLDTLAPLIKEHLPELIADAERRRAPVDALAPLLETHLADAPPAAMEEVEALVSELLAKHYYAPYRSDPGPVGNRHLSGQRLSYYRRSSADLHEAVGRRHPVILATTSEPRRQARELIDAARAEDRTVYIWTLASGLFEINWDDEGTRSFLPATPQRIRTALQRTSQFDDPIQRMILLHVMEENRLGSTEGGLPVFIDVKSRFASTDVYLFVDDVDENGDPVPFDGDLGNELQATLSERMHEIEQLTAGKHYPGNDPKNPFALAELVGYIVEQRPSNALIVIQDVDQYLDKSMDRIASHTASVLRDASIRMGRLEQGPQMVLLGSELSAPANLTREVLQLQLPLPTARELTACFRQILPREFGWGDTSPPQDPHATNDDLLRLAQSASGMSLSEATEAIRSGLQSSNGDAERLLQSVQRAKRSGVRVNPALEVVDTSALSASLGGMESFMSWLQPREKVFKHPDKARDAGIGRAPRGVLLLGIPGTGKSLAAKEIARRWGFSLVRLDMGALQDKWLGESERNIRSALRIVDAMSPCILWIDEIDKGIGQEQTHSAAQNVNATLLTWLQESRAPAFVVATANRFGGLPPELTRAGRFDGRFFFGCPGAEGRLEILRIHLAARNCELSEAPLDSVISLTEGFTGAELEQVVLDGLYAAFAEDRPLSIKDLQQACHGVKPLVASVGKGLDEIWAMIDHGRVTPASEHMLNRTQLMKLIDPQRFRPIYCRLENIEGWDQISSRGAVSLMDDPYRGAAAIVLETGDDQWALVQTNVYAEKGDRWHWKFLDRVETLGVNGVFDVLITEHCVEVILFESPSTLSRFAEHEYLGAYAELFQVVGRGREFAGFADAQVVKS